MRLAWGQRVVMVAMAVSLLWAIPTAMSILANNVWSVKAARQMLYGDGSVSELPPVPAGHPREALWWGRLALNEGDADAAVVWFQRQAQMTPGDLLTTVALGEALVAQGEFAQGVVHLKRAKALVQLRRAGWDALQKQHWDDALLALWAAYELRPWDPQVVSGLAFALHTVRHDVDGAIELLRQAIAGLSDATSIVRLKQDLCRVYEREGRWQEAIAIYREILVAYPTDSRTHARLGWAMYQAERPTAAVLRELKLAIDLAPHNSEGYMQLGRFYLSEQQYTKATDMFRLAADLAPDSKDPLIALADTALASGDVLLAIDLLTEAAARFPDDAYIYYRIADAYYWYAGDAPSAIAAIEKALAITQQDARYWVLAGRIYEKVQQSSGAAESFQAALTLDPANKAAKDGLARLQLEEVPE